MNKFNTIQSWILIMRKGNILENPENAGEEFKMQNSYEFSACGRGDSVAMRDAGDLVGLQ